MSQPALGQSWATFVKNHAERMWACDFIQTHDILFHREVGWLTVPELPLPTMLQSDALAAPSASARVGRDG